MKKFTLLELLVVIAIIGILASMLIPSLSAAKEKSKTVVCRANLSQMGKAIAMYIDDYEGRFPSKVAGSGKHGWIGKTGSSTSLSKTELYSDARPLNDYAGGPYSQHGEVKVAHCPSDSVKYATRGSSYKNNTEMNWDSLHLAGGGGQSVNIAAVVNPEKMVAMAEWGFIPSIKGNNDITQFHSIYEDYEYNTLFIDSHVDAIEFFNGTYTIDSYTVIRIILKGFCFDRKAENK